VDIKKWLNYTDEMLDDITHNKRGIDPREATQLFMYRLMTYIHEIRVIEGFADLALPVQQTHASYQ
jgi:hypothetical protein